ncbi:GFA family protein [Paraburkholderia agricolaris]|uniref:GFA family protein n=1 Tax=Paraburkholderia agricolaris TaxID=2152888 RepID=A0ABW8ZM94_9BURK|nr:GFA family protein [Paraburkholderia agricolaris]
MLRTYRGGCHCQSVRFEAQIDFSEGTVKCNCTFCSKARLWLVNVRPEAFRLLTDENALTVYRGKNPVAHHPFCKQCGVHVFDRVDMPNETGFPYININIMCVDDLNVDEALSAPIVYVNGLQNDWSNPPLETRHL